VHGSHGLAQTLIRHGLVDEYRMWVFPLVLGYGKRLFGVGTVPTTMDRTQTRFTSTGVAVHTYLPSGPLRHGEFTVASDGSEEVRSRNH
jgi:dihydrofolate reductase